MSMMYDFHSSLFLYKFVFSGELLAAELLVGLLLKKRSYFLLRLFGVTVVLAGITFALPIPVYDAGYVSALFAVIFLASVFLLKFCFRESFGNLLACSIFAYTIQHLSSVTGSYISNMCGLNGFAFYGSTPFATTDLYSLIICFGIYFLLYGACWAYLVLCLIPKRHDEEIRINHVVLVVLAGAMLLVNVVMNAVIVYEFSLGFSRVLLTVYWIYDTTCALFVVGMLFFAVRNTELQGELNVIHLLWERDKETYRIKKERIETINVMCHDLRHQLRELRKNGYTEDLIYKMEQSIGEYDNTYKTGNEVLDVIFTEIGLYCFDHEIQFLCTADGEALAFVQEDDLYSLFDNILHNAVEATENVKDAERRVIKVQISRKRDAVSVYVENPCVSDALIFHNGLPVSTNANKKLHGFGMKSISMIVERLGGGLDVTAKDGRFCLSLIIPMP